MYVSKNVINIYYDDFRGFGDASLPPTIVIDGKGKKIIFSNSSLQYHC